MPVPFENSIPRRSSSAWIKFKVVGFSAAAPASNLLTVSRAKPAAVKGAYIKKISISSTMGPGITLDLADVLAQVA